MFGRVPFPNSVAHCEYAASMFWLYRFWQLKIWTVPDGASPLAQVTSSVSSPSRASTACPLTFWIVSFVMLLIVWGMPWMLQNFCKSAASGTASMMMPISWPLPLPRLVPLYALRISLQ